MLDGCGSAGRAVIFRIGDFAQEMPRLTSTNRRLEILFSSRGIELLVERATKLQWHYWFMRNAEIVTSALVKKPQIGFAGQDQAGDRVVEQGADGQNWPRSPYGHHAAGSQQSGCPAGGSTPEPERSPPQR